MARTRIERSDRLLVKLNALRKVLEVPVHVALETGCQEIVRMAKSWAPDGRGAGDRDYKSTIRYTFREPTRAAVIAGNEKNPEGPWLEFGTAPHVNGGIYKGSVNPGTAPQPHFFPAFRANKKSIKSKVNRAIRDAIKGAVQ